MSKPGRPAGTKSNKNWIAKGVRLSKEEWDKLDAIAEDLSKTLLIDINTSTLVRKAVLELLAKYSKE